MLIIDEVHNLLAGSYREQRRFLNMLRFLANDLCASLVVFGVNEALEAIRGDDQLARRLDVDHRAYQGLNNRIEGSQRKTRKREKIQGRFKSARQAQRLLAVHDETLNLFRPRRHKMSYARKLVTA